MRWTLPGLAICTALLLAGCEARNSEQEPLDSTVMELPEATPADAPGDASQAQIGTPMEERVATIGLLNKRNNVSEDLKLKPGASQRVGDVEVRVEACERTPPWELPKETGAFVQVSVRGRGEEGYRRIFSGWLFKNSPSLNVVEHPIYDVWVKDCEMSFPGEE